jgi:hypothetical protein
MKGEAMTDIQPKYFDQADPCLAYLEFTAIKKFAFNGRATDVYDAFDCHVKSLAWVEATYQKAKQGHKDILASMGNGEIADLDGFYTATSKLLKQKPRGRMLKDKKKRTAQKAYQRDTKGDAFIDNDPLFHAAAKAAVELAEAGADGAAVIAKAATLAKEFDDGTLLTDAQMTVLCDYIGQRIDKHQQLDRIEAALIDDPNKNAYYMWGQIKRRCVKGDTIAWSQATAAKHCHCSKSDVPEIMEKLVKAGAVKQLEKGKQGSNSQQAAIYRREV